MSILGKIENFSDNQVIFREAEYGEKMYVILKGLVKIIKEEKKGGGYIVTIFEIGDFFGEMSVVRGSKRTATAKAIGDVQCRVLDLADFKMLILYNPSISMKMIHNLCNRVEESLLKNESLSVELRTQKILFILINIATKNGELPLKRVSFRYTEIVEQISNMLNIEETQVDFILISLSRSNKFDISEKKGIHYIDISRKIFFNDLISNHEPEGEVL